MSIAKREEEILVHSRDSNIDTRALEAYRTSKQVAEGLLVERSNEFYIVNLHAGQTNASGHSKNFRGSAMAPAQYSHVTKLFQRIRDESHRFAVSYHTVLKRTKQTASSLEDIPGVGPATRRQLIRTFGSLRGIKNASEAELSAVVGQAKAKRIIGFITSM